MKLYVFRYKNYYSSWGTFRVVANSREEAESLLMADEHCNKFIYDDDTDFVECLVYELDKPQLIR